MYSVDVSSIQKIRVEKLVKRPDSFDIVSPYYAMTWQTHRITKTQNTM